MTKKQVKAGYFKFYDQHPFGELMKKRFRYNGNMPSNLSDAIYKGFVWERTPEKFVFWNKVYQLSLQS